MSASIDIKAMVEKVYTNVTSMIVGKDINLSNIVPIVTAAMKEVEKLAGALKGGASVDGQQKKQMVIDVVKQIISDMVPSDKQGGFTDFITLTLPNVIDTVVAASSGKFDINKIKSGCFAC